MVKSSILRDVLPSFYWDERYVNPVALAFLYAMDEVLYDVQEEIKSTWLSRFFPSTQNFLAMLHHQKLWDLLNTMPEKDIFDVWIQNEGKNSSHEDRAWAQKYLCGLYQKRLKRMLPLLVQGMGHPDAYRNIFAAFFYYDMGQHPAQIEYPSENFQKNTQFSRENISQYQTSYVYNLKPDKSENVGTKAVVNLIIREPIWEFEMIPTCFASDDTPSEGLAVFASDTPEENYNAICCFDSSTRGSPSTGMELHINSTFEGYKLSAPSVLEGRPKEIYLELKKYAQEIFDDRSKLYFESLVSLVRAAGVPVKIFYEIPILEESERLKFSETHEIEIIFSKTLQVLDWQDALFAPTPNEAGLSTVNCFDTSRWAGSHIDVHVQRDQK